MRRAFLAVFAVSLVGIEAHAASTVFEKADALYRRKEVPLTGVFFGHAGIYLNDQSTYGNGVTRTTFQSGQLPDIVADGGHSVIQAPGYARGGVQIVSFTQFLDGNPPWGAYEPSGMSAAQRQRIIIAAGSNLQADYTLWFGWKGTGTPPRFRCDGLVSYAYAQAKVPIPENPGGWLTNFPRTQRSQLKAMNGGNPASARAPVCAAATAAASGGGFTLSVAQVKDDANGSGIDHVEFWNGNPASGGSFIATDEHGSNPDAGLTASSAYSVNSSINPGTNLFTRAYDQAGNYATCDANGNTVATSDLAQISPTISEDVTPPTIGTINIPPGSQSITATWSATDDVTPSSQINFAYTIDVPFDQWDDPNVTILGAQTSVTVDVSTMTEGQHTFYLIALDQEGNMGSASQTFVIDRTRPRIVVAGPDGQTIVNGGFTKGANISIGVDDTVIGVNQVSGPGRVRISYGDMGTGGTLIGSSDVKFVNAHTYTAADIPLLAQLPEGLVTIQAFDQGGNGSDPVNFVVDHTPPRLALADAKGAGIDDGGFTKQRYVSVSVDDSAPGIGQTSDPALLEVYQGDPANGTLLGSSTRTFSVPTSTYNGSDDGLSVLGRLPVGRITIRAADQAGNSTSASFTVLGGSLTVVGDAGEVIGNGASLETDYITIYGPPGTARLEVNGPVFDGVETFSFEEEPIAESDSLEDGTYTVSAFDGNGTLIDRVTFTVPAEGGGYGLIGTADFEPGGAAGASLGSVIVSGVNASTGGTIAASLRAWDNADPGFRSVPADSMYQISASDAFDASGLHPFVTTPFTVALPLDPGLTPGQLETVRVVSGVTEVPFTRAGNSVLVTGYGGGYAVLVSEFPNPVVLKQGQVTVIYDKSVGDVSLGPPDPSSAEYKRLLAAAGYGGQIPASRVVQLGPEHKVVNGVIQIDYGDASLDPAQLSVVDLSDGAQPRKLPNQFGNYATPKLSAALDRIDSFFGVFLATTSRLAADFTPPQTSLSFVGAVSTGTPTVVQIDTVIGLAAVDPVVTGAVTSGVATTYFMLDASTIPVVYQSTFTLSLGSHTVAFYSVDNASNVESTQTATLQVVRSVPTQPVGNGLGIGVAPDSSIWELARSSSGLVLEKYSPGLQLELVDPIPEGKFNGNWMVHFDTMSGVYAIGITSGPLTIGRDLTVYKFTSDGIFVSSAQFHGGIGKRAIGFDSTGDIWIAGAVLDSPTATWTLSLWRYCVHTGLLTQTAQYARGGTLDMGLGVRVVGDHVWVADASAATAQSTMADLVLLEYDATGRSLIGGPFVTPNVADIAHFDVAARLESTSSDLYVAMSKVDSSGASGLGFFHFDQTGQLRLQQTWPAQAGLETLPNAMTLDPYGDLFVAGELASNTQDELATWTYAPSGLPVSNSIDGTHGGAKGLAVASSRGFLAVMGQATPLPISFSAPPPPPAQYPAALLSQAGLSTPAGGLAVSALGNFLYVSEPSPGQVLRLSLDSRTQASWTMAAPGAVAASDSEGVFVADTAGNRVVRFDPRGTQLIAAASTLQSATAVAEDPTDDSFYVVDTPAGVLRKFGPRGQPAGTFLAGQLSSPRGLAIDAAGERYVVDGGHNRVFVSNPNGTNRQFGTGLIDPFAIAVAADGTSYVSDRADHSLHVFDGNGAALGVIGGFGRGAFDFASVTGLGLDPAGRLYAADGTRVVVLQPGQLPQGSAPALGALTVDNASPSAGDLELAAPTPQAALYDLRFAAQPILSDADFAAAKPVPLPGFPSAPGTIDALRVSGLTPGATVYVGLKAYDAAGRVSNLATASFTTLRSVQKGTLVTVAGDEGFTWLGDGWPGTQAAFVFDRGLAEDSAGNVYVTDDGGGSVPDHMSRIRKLDAATGLMSTVAGGSGVGFSGDGGPALQAKFGKPRGIAIDAQGDIFVADHDNNRIREISASGIVATIAGTGVAGYSGDGGPASAAQVNGPFFMIVDGSGNPIFADSGNNRVRKIDMKTGVISTLAGNGQAGSTGDGGPATQASLNFDIDVALSVDAANDLFISEVNGNRIRKVDGRSGIITTIAGDGTQASTGDGGPAGAAQVAAPTGLAVDPVGNLYFSEIAGNKIRRIDARTGIVTTVAGDGAAGAFGEDGPALSAELYGPADLLLDAKAGLLYVGDVGNNRVAALGLEPFLSAQSTATVGGQPEAVVASTAPFSVTQVSSASQAGAVLLSTAASQGLQPVGDVFVISPLAAPGAPVEVSFTFDPTGVDTAAVSIYHYDGVSWSSSVVFNQAITVLPNGFYQITGEAFLTSPFGVFVYHPDFTPPVTTLSIGSPSAALPDGSTLVAARTQLWLTAVDARTYASGVKQTFVSIDSTPFAAYAATFTLTGADGLHTVGYYSVDKAGNVERTKTAAFTLDSTAPAVQLRSPGGAGFCSLLKAAVPIPVLGSVNDPHLSSWLLDAAAGKDAQANFSKIAGGTSSISGQLASWNTSAFSGWQTLRLSAADQVSNISAQIADVYAGDPATLAVFSGNLNKPGGAAQDAQGRVWVADRNDDQVVVFTSTGGVAAVFGGGHGKNAPLSFNKPEAVAIAADGSAWVADANNKRLARVSLGGQLLQQIALSGHPHGLALDAQGRVYSSLPDSSQVAVFTAGGASAGNVALPGAAPQGLAVDAAGELFVADSATGRVLVVQNGAVTATYGGFAQPFGVAVSLSGECLAVADAGQERVALLDRLGAVLASYGPKGAFNSLSNAALDASGNLLVADRNNDRVVLLGPPAPGAPVPVASASGSNGPPPAAHAVLAKDFGGTVARTDKTQVVIPPLALSQDLEVSVDAPRAQDPAQGDKAAAKGLKTVSQPVDFGPEGTQFVVPVTISLPYDPQLVAAYGARETDLKVQYWNPTTKDWEALDSAVDPVARTVTARTSHFSLYQVLAPAAPSSISPAAAGQAFGWVDLYAFPNPAVRGASPTIRVQAGAADSIDVSVFDIAGRRVQAGGSTSWTVVDDGNGKGSQPTFDWGLDASNLGSGVYTYLVTAHKVGQKDLRRAGKLAVVK